MTYLHRLAQPPEHRPEYTEAAAIDELFVCCAACGPDSVWPCEFAEGGAP